MVPVYCEFINLTDVYILRQNRKIEKKHFATMHHRKGILYKLSEFKIFPFL